jgi:FtsP/CotA-like multicopper oxidase with cupredoxin domain
MAKLSGYLWATVVCGFSFVGARAQCPPYPEPNTVVQDAPSIYSQNGVLTADFTMGHSVDQNGYTHYCYKYATPAGVVESPTLRVNPGDRLMLNVQNRIASGSPESKGAMEMEMSAPVGVYCGDGGNITVESTNVHFHGMNVPPTCHQDDVLNTLIQPGTPPFPFDIQIPAYEPPGLYWYHPHIHGFTEFQVNGGASGAIIVEGMEKYRPEVTGLTERVFTIRQEYLVPWVPGPYQLTFNYQNAGIVQGPSPQIVMKPGEKQFWRVLNATLQDFMPLQVWFDSVPQPMQLIALDGYPLAQTRTQDTILVPPAGRAEFIVQAPPSGVTGLFEVLGYNTGPTGNPDLIQPLAEMVLSDGSSRKQGAKAAVTSPQPSSLQPSTTQATPQMTYPQISPSQISSPQMTSPQISSSVSMDHLKFAGLKDATPTATRKLYFSEEFGGTNGPIQFYITVDGEKPKVFEPAEKPTIITHVGAVEDWTIENRALETHDFHIHQIHFLLLEINGKPVPNQELRDTFEVPYWSGSGPYPSIKVRMDFRDPNTAGTFVYHCHILLHEDMGMMHKIQVLP